MSHRHIAQTKAKLLTKLFSLQALQHWRRLKHVLLGFFVCFPVDTFNYKYIYILIRKFY